MPAVFAKNHCHPLRSAWIILWACVLLLLSACGSIQPPTQVVYKVTLNADGKPVNVEVPAGTTAQVAVERAGLTLNPLDRLEPPGYTVLAPGDTIRLVRVREVIDRDQADLWRGRYLLVDAARVPAPDPDDVFVSALIGMTVEVEGRGQVGHVRDVYEAPQGLLLEIEMPTGRPLVPWHPDIIERVDEDARVIVIKPLEGLLE